MAKAKQLELKEEHTGIKIIDEKKLKKELEEYIDEKITKTPLGEIEKANKRLIREKNKKIASKNIIIIILLAIIAGLVFLMYDDEYFDRLFNNEKKSKVENKIITDKGDEEDEITLDDLKKEYGYLLDNIYISDSSNYLEEYYNGELTTELKNSLALNLVNFDKLEEDEDSNIIPSDLLEDTYKGIFNDKYENKSFKYNDNKIKYVSKLDSYITGDILEKDDTNIRREITNIEVDKKIVKITTIEGKVVDNKVFNILENKELGDYNDNLGNYYDDLNKITYIFNDKKLESIEK